MLGKSHYPYVERFEESVRKNYIYYIGFIVTVCFFELIMMVRAALFFDLSQWEFLVYFICYIFLGLASLVTVLLLLFKKDWFFANPKWLAALGLTYGTAILAWATTVSAVDVSRTQYPIVLLTVLMTVSCLNILPTLYFVILTLLGAGTVIVIGMNAGMTSSGYLLNLSSFFVMVILIAFRSQRLFIRELDYAKRLGTLSYIDELTNTYNRRAMDERIHNLILEDNPFFLIMGDIDRFKEFNDQNGRAFGDDCMKTVSDKLIGLFDKQVYRYGGAEFVVISFLPKEEVREKLESLAGGFFYQDAEISMSFGVVSYETGMNEDDLFREADHLLAAAKRLGDGQIVFEENFAD